MSLPPFLAADTPTNLDYNVLVSNGNLVGDEAELFFSGEYLNVIGIDEDFFDILVRAGIFTSRNNARKNNFKAEIPPGITEIYIGKRRVRIYILNPTDKNVLTHQEGIE